MKPTTLAAAKAHAIEEYPKESCGYVIAVGRKEIYMPCRNVADDPNSNFVIDPRDSDAAEDKGRIKMVVHSHPDSTPYPTDSDLKSCEETGVPWAILAAHTDPADEARTVRVTAVHEFAPSGYQVPLRGREFVFGTQDCYTLVQDYYSRELGVDLPDFERKDKFWERGEDLYMDNFRAAGFSPIDTPSQKGDLILMAIRSDIVNHAGIWLGEGQAMLHHPYMHLSEKVIYGGYWGENTRLFIRRNF